MNILNKPIILSCNRFWKALRPTTPTCAFVDMAKGTVKAVHIEYFQGPDGEFDFDTPITMDPVGWDEWITLKPRPFDFVIHTPRLTIRVPTVIVCVEYEKTPTARKKLTNRAIYERDGYIDQYTGQKLSRHQVSTDHIWPRAHGGKTTWENCVTTSKEINQKKGNRFNHEVGLRLIRQPKAPPIMPVCANIKEIVSPDWNYFIIK